MFMLNNASNHKEFCWFLFSVHEIYIYFRESDNLIFQSVSYFRLWFCTLLKNIVYN